MAEDHHAILGVRADASMDEILQAYSELVERFHPDLNRDDPDAEKKFLRIQHSFEMLYEPERHPVVGVFHTHGSAFMRVQCLRHSVRRYPYSSNGFLLPLIAMATILYPFVLLAVFAILIMWQSTYGTTTKTPDISLEQGTYAIIGTTLVYILFVVIVLLKIPRR